MNKAHTFNLQPQLSPSPTHKFEIYFKHMEHIKHTNQRKINQNYIEICYKNNNTKNNLKPNTKNLLKHPNTHIKKPIPLTNINRTNYNQHQLKHIDNLTKTHILGNILARPYKRNKNNNTKLGSGTIEKQITSPLANKKHKLMKPNKNISNSINPYIYEKRIKNIKTRHSNSPNQTQKTSCTKKLVCMCNILTLSSSTQCRIKMAGGSKGTARNLTIDPDFIMRDSISPPIGTKRSGGNRTTSTEKKNKLAPKEATTSPTNFWLGFDMMERLAIDEGAPLIFSPTPIHNLIKSGFSEKEAKEYLNSVHSYPRVTQSCYPLHRPDGIAGQHFNITNSPSR